VDDGRLAAAYRAHGQALLTLGRPADAMACFTAALAVFERGGRERDIGVTLIGLGEALIAGGHEAEAVTWLRQARQILFAQADFYHQARAQAALGMALAHQPRLARSHLEHALAVRRRLGRLPEQATILRGLGDLAARDGEPARARQLYQQALAMLPGTHPASRQVRKSLAALAG
jgi:tetratricopeptide (TPR) repeat protein